MPDRFTQKALEQGKLLILLDGLDEVPAAIRDASVETIQDFVDQYDKNRFITSCRTAVSRRNVRRFTDVTIAEFDDDQIRQFIGNWFQSGVDQQSGTAERCWELLQQPENAAAKELAHTPPVTYLSVSGL
jgi:predicted NACHT family NTPase